MDKQVDEPVIIILDEDSGDRIYTKDATLDCTYWYIDLYDNRSKLKYDHIKNKIQSMLQLPQNVKFDLVVLLFLEIFV